MSQNQPVEQNYESTKVTVKIDENGKLILTEKSLNTYVEANEGEAIFMQVRAGRHLIFYKVNNQLIARPTKVDLTDVDFDIVDNCAELYGYNAGITSESKAMKYADVQKKYPHFVFVELEEANIATNKQIDNFVNKFLLGAEPLDKTQKFNNKLKVKENDQVSQVNKAFCNALKEAINQDDFLKQKIAETDPKKLEEFASKIIMAMGKIQFAETNAKDKGATFVENIGMKNGASFRKSLVDFVVSAFYSLITLDSTPLRNWGKNNAQIIVHDDANKFEEFLKEVPAPHAVEKGKTNLRMAFDEIAKASSSQAKS